MGILQLRSAERRVSKGCSIPNLFLYMTKLYLFTRFTVRSSGAEVSPRILATYNFILLAKLLHCCPGIVVPEKTPLLFLKRILHSPAFLSGIQAFAIVKNTFYGRCCKNQPSLRGALFATKQTSLWLRWLRSCVTFWHADIGHFVKEDMLCAIAREKQIKGGSRKKKLALIERINPKWTDLYTEIL